MAAEKAPADNRLWNEKRFRRFVDYVEKTIEFGQPSKPFPLGAEHTFALDWGSHLIGFAPSDRERVDILKAYKSKVKADFIESQWDRTGWLPITLYDFLSDEEVLRFWTEKLGSDDYVFRREKDSSFFIVFDGKRFSLPALQGLDYIQQLLRSPSEEIPALRLEALSVTSREIEVSRSTEEVRDVIRSADLAVSDRGGLDDLVFDRKAQRNFKQAIESLREEATHSANPQKAMGSREKAKELEQWLSKDIGLKGKPRKLRSEPDAARRRVKESVGYALEKIKGHSPELADHLKHRIKTGLRLTYTPDQTRPIDWSF